MTGHGQFVLQRPSINSIQKAFLAGGTQPSSHWPLPLLSSPSYLWSYSDKNLYKKKPHLDHSLSVTVDAAGIGRPNPAQENRLGLAELNECHFHASFPTRFLSSLFSSLSNSFMLGVSAPFPSSSPSYLFLHNAYKDVPANSSSQPSSITSFLKVQLHSLGPHLFTHKLL